MPRTLIEAKNRCAERVKRKLNISKSPAVIIMRNKLSLLPDGWTFRIQFKKGVVEGPDFYCPDDFYDNEGIPWNPIDLLREVYPVLFFHTDRNGKVHSDITEVRVHFGEVTISAGFNWTIMGSMVNSNEKFCAVLSLFTRPLFRDCGVASLLKKDEIQYAIKSGCTFIHTWHDQDNPYFISAIIPALKNGFFLYRGQNVGGQQYEGAGCIHLRKYLDGRVTAYEVKLEGFQGRLLSPDENDKIAGALLKTRRRYPGRIIQSVDCHAIIPKDIHAVLPSLK